MPEKPIGLPETAARLLKVDMLIIALANVRLDLAREVERCKFAETDTEKRKIFNKKREAERLKNVEEWADKHGMDTTFARSLLYFMINESCKQQMIQYQNRVGGSSSQNEDEWNEYRQNLLELARLSAASYGTTYDKNFSATQAYRTFEDNLLRQEIQGLSSHRTLLDIGCANGRSTFQFSHSFEKSIGYDVSPDMIAEANARIPESEKNRVSFKVADIENGIPEPDKSVSFAVMNFGTASDIRDIRKVLREINRVLTPHGRFLLSFYNFEALLYRWDFIPWPISLTAKINIHRECLEVQVDDRILSVFAKAYTVGQITDMIRGGITISEVQTYPTISAILPNDFLYDQPDVQSAVKSMDMHLATDNGGAYIVVTGQKIR